MEEFLKAAKNGEAYGYIANHYHEMSRFDLRTILLEYIYFCECEETVYDSLEDNWGGEE